MPKTEPAVVIALTSGYYGVDDKAILVIEGELFRVDDPVVKKYPASFGPQNAPTDPVVIEQATAAPGEKRGR